MAIPGCGPLIAAKFGKTAPVDRLHSKDALLGATGPRRFRYGHRARSTCRSRTGNRQLNAAIHRIALTQARCPRRASIVAPKASGDGGMEHFVKRRLSDVVLKAMAADLSLMVTPTRPHPR
ncbi:transposase (plasmid) [Rhodococcus sp. ZPP]|nr:transposase [Rhodococcus sp. ZPP]